MNTKIFSGTKVKKFQGVVLSDKTRKTIIVEVAKTKRHKKYHKQYTVFKRFKVHDENNAYHPGDVVEIEESKPVSKEKSWKVVRKI